MTGRIWRSGLYIGAQKKEWKIVSEKLNWRARMLKECLPEYFYNMSYKENPKNQEAYFFSSKEKYNRKKKKRNFKTSEQAE